MSAIGLLLGAAAVKGITGLAQNLRANQLAKKNGIDNQVLNKEYGQNLQMAERLARQGMAGGAYQRQADLIGSNQAFAVRRMLGSGQRNMAGNIANIQSNSNRAVSALGARDAEMQLANQSRVMSARDIIARAKQRSYEQNAQAIAGLKGAGIQNMAGAADMIAGGVIYGGDNLFEGGGEEVMGEAFTTQVPVDQRSAWMKSKMNQYPSFKFGKK